MSERKYEFVEYTYDDRGMHKSKPVTVTESWMEQYLAERKTKTRTVVRPNWMDMVCLHRMFTIEALFTLIK